MKDMWQLHIALQLWSFTLNWFLRDEVCRFCENYDSQKTIAESIAILLRDSYLSCFGVCPLPLYSWGL